MLSSDV